MRTLAALASLVVAAPAAALAADKTHLDFRAEARTAYEKKDYRAALAATAEALKLRPDSPRYLHNLAALAALAGDRKAALDHLRRLAALGVATAIERDPDLASLQGTPEFQQVLELFAANRAPRGNATVLVELPGRTGILEGIAARDRTGDLFLGDVHHRCIWRRGRDGDFARFTADDEDLAGIFGLAIDEPRQSLWATMAAVPEMEGFAPEMKGFTALAEFDLRTGELRHVTPVPNDGREHLLGDLVVAPDGTVYATDSRTPIVWQFAPGADEPQKLLELPALSSLQGLVLQNRTLLVADHANGLVAVDLATRHATPLAPPENVTLLGLDGLTLAAGHVVATQNGTTPQRVLRLVLAPEWDRIVEVQVLASGLPHLEDLALVTTLQDRPTFVAGAGWEAFEAAKGRTPPAHTTRIFQLDLP